MKEKIITIILITLLVMLSITIALIVLILTNTKNENIKKDYDDEVIENIANNGNVQNIYVDTYVSEEEEAEEIIYDNEAKDVTNPTYFYTIQECIIKYVNSKNDKLTLLCTVKMLQLQIEDNNVIRFVARTVFLNEKQNIEYFNFIVYLDYLNLTYIVEDMDSTITDLKRVDLKTDIDEIKFDDNQYTYIITTTDSLVNNYLNTFRTLALKAPDMAYEYLDDEYRSKEFNNIENFKEYILQNEFMTKNIELNNYIETDEEEYNEYTCIDVMNNRYVIRETAIMQFTIILDDNNIEVSEE